MDDSRLPMIPINHQTGIRIYPATQSWYFVPLIIHGLRLNRHTNPDFRLLPNLTHNNYSPHFINSVNRVKQALNNMTPNDRNALRTQVWNRLLGGTAHGQVRSPVNRVRFPDTLDAIQSGELSPYLHDVFQEHVLTRVLGDNYTLHILGDMIQRANELEVELPEWMGAFVPNMPIPPPNQQAANIAAATAASLGPQPLLQHMPNNNNPELAAAIAASYEVPPQPSLPNNFFTPLLQQYGISGIRGGYSKRRRKITRKGKKRRRNKGTKKR